MCKVYVSMERSRHFVGARGCGVDAADRRPSTDAARFTTLSHRVNKLAERTDTARPQ